MLGQQYAYEFDSIGNRIAAAEGDTSRIATYTANALNQYAQRTVPNERDLIGTAPTNVAVTINAEPATRQFAYWHHALEVANATDAAYPQVAITAVYNPPGTNDPDVVTAHTGRVFVAETPESFTYDDDGNLTQDGRFDYTWNGENRLVLAETREDLPAGVPCVKVEYAYDHQGRMVWKQFSTNTVILSTRTLLWDGYNIVQELITDNGSPITTNAYVWGLDLSGSLQGAGGVGGLLAEVIDGAPYFATFDANGNVTEYVSTNGTIAAHYEYSPFGEIVAQSGDLADSFTHRFSTKPWCEVTGLSEYEKRKYRPGVGRWLNRDPKGEQVGINLSVYARNQPTHLFDFLGMWPGFVQCSPSGAKTTTKWLLRTMMPDNSGGSGDGIGVYDAVLCSYTRTETIPYDCPCTCPKNTIKKNREVTYYEERGHIIDYTLWQTGSPGPWPPMDIPGVVADIILQKLFPPQPLSTIPKDRCLKSIPADSTVGTEILDTGEPTRFCVWK